MSDEHLLNAQVKVVPFFDIFGSSCCDTNSLAKIQRNVESNIPVDFENLVDYDLEKWSTYHESFHLIINTMFLFGLCLLTTLIIGAFIYFWRQILVQEPPESSSNRSVINLSLPHGENGASCKNRNQCYEASVTSSFPSMIRNQFNDADLQRHLVVSQRQESRLVATYDGSSIDRFLHTSIKQENSPTILSSNLLTAQEEIIQSALERTITACISTSKEKETAHKTEQLAKPGIYYDRLTTLFPISPSGCNGHNLILPRQENSREPKGLSHKLLDRNQKIVYRPGELVRLFPKVQLQTLNDSLDFISVLDNLFPRRVPKYGDLIEIDRMLTEIRLLLMNETIPRQPISDKATRSIAAVRFLSLSLNIKQNQNPFIFLPSYHRIIQQLIDTGAVWDIFEICQPLLTHAIIETITEYCNAMWNYKNELTDKVQNYFNALGLRPTLQQPFQCFKFVINMELMGINNNKVKIALANYAANNLTRIDKLILGEAIKLSRDECQKTFFSQLLTIKGKSWKNDSCFDRPEISGSAESTKKPCGQKNGTVLGEMVQNSNGLPGHI
ncbi:BA75_01059T0 [Komagataella pastoris]|uniref:BA75_01059T0 n=1 Tax=Komagataella pastoris TaxID=4922 RepID=A0A1B2J6A0_PICPA|nr:BA75_01059T0 [Komagataella pastoris]